MPLKHDSDCCKTTLPPEIPDLTGRALLFKALGEEVRLKLLYLIRDQEVCVCDLVTALKMAQGTLSHHLAILRQAALATSRKQGRWNYYTATELAKRPLAVFDER